MTSTIYYSKLLEYPHQVVKLCELEAGDSVTAISWALKGDSTARTVLHCSYCTALLVLYCTVVFCGVVYCTTVL
jgi:hypothetical protein